MLKRHNYKALSMFLSLCIILSLFSATALTAFADDDLLISVTSAGAVTENEIAESEGLDAVPPPLDPQSWVLNRDQTWNDLRVNPVVNWMTELNPAGLVNPQAAGSNRPIVGGLILIEYLDRKFISSGTAGSDPLGYYMFNSDGSGMQDTVTNNPVYDVPQLIADEKGIARSAVTNEMFSQWWADFLNKPQAINNQLTVDGFWRENSYGKWAVDLDPHGPFTIPYFEFETMGYDIGSSFQTLVDVPPTFRPATNAAAFRFDTVAVQQARADGVPFASFDFFFLLHAGYAESGVWQEFGQSQFKTRADIPYELGPGPRLTQAEQILTKNPELLDIYVARYPTKTVFSEAVTRRDALAAEGKLSEFTFKLPQEDWDWVAGYNAQTARNTRYVPFTSWQAAVGEWSHMSTIADSVTGAGKSLRYSTQGENNGMATFAHEFGHVSGLSDNYGNPWSNPYSPDTEPWDLMSRGSFAGPGGDHARWTVPGVESESVPVHMMQGGKKALNYYNEGDLLSVSVQELASSTPVVANIVARNIPLDNQYNNFGVSGDDYVKGIELSFGSGAWADQAVLQGSGYTWTRVRAQRMAIEVVEQTAYDTYTNDHGVLLSRINSNSGRQVIDSHLYDIDMVDYYLNGEPSAYPISHAAQLADATFHAGLSSVDTGYYKGGEFKGDKRASSEIVSGDTVNEFHDPYNKLNFYVLNKHVNKGKYGDFLSYEVGVLRTDGKPVNGEILVTSHRLTKAIPGKVAIQEFKITNTGDATDIVRVELGGNMTWKTTLQNNLFAIKANETITVPVYIEVDTYKSFPVPVQNLTMTATSESNPAKTNSATVENVETTASTLALLLSMEKAVIYEGDYFYVDAAISQLLNANVAVLDFGYDKDVLDYAGYQLPAGVTMIGTPERTDDGVRMFLMVQDYKMLDLVSVMFQSRKDIEEPLELVQAYAQIVNKYGDNQVDKEVITLSTSLNFAPKDPIRNIDLIYLSNVIDALGTVKGDANWPNVTKYDWNNNGVIDIADVAYAAQRVVI